MMKDVLDMVNFVSDAHSMRNALDTYDTIFRVRPSCSVDSSGSNEKHDLPQTKSWIRNTLGSTGKLLLPDQPYMLVIQTGSAKESGQTGQPSSANPGSSPGQVLGQNSL